MDHSIIYNKKNSVIQGLNVHISEEKAHVVPMRLSTI